MSDGLRTVEEQRALITAAVLARGPVAAVTVPLDEAFGRTLREPVRAAVAIPAFDNSGMDGFAVRFADVADADAAAPVSLRVIADLPAGSADDPAMSPGEAVRIMTGSALPSDADTVVPFEHTAGGLSDSLVSVTIVTPPRSPGEHVRRRGADAHPGDEVLPAGVALGAFQISAAAGAGVASVVVSRRPRVAVVSTGDELVEPGLPLRRGQIPESNGRLIAHLAVEAGAEIVLRTVVDDEGSALRAAVARATDLDADVVVFSGGVSAGAYEVVKNQLGGSMTFTKVAMQPGKPQGFGAGLDDAGRATGPLLFGLPGNPVSVAVSFAVFVRPALLALHGRRVTEAPVLRLPAADAWRTPPGRRQYLPAVIDRTDPGSWTVRPATAGGSGSHLVGGLGSAEALAVVAADVDAVRAGDLVDVMLL